MLYTKNNPENEKYWQLITTSDGSQTLYNAAINESYHSRFGAVQESKHVFINAGLQHCIEQNTNKINILEVGFGTGLNALLTLKFAVENNILVEYTAIEAFPLPAAIITQLQYPELTGITYKNYFLQMHQSQSGKMIQLHKNFSFYLFNQTLESCALQQNHYNLIYFDAFSPEVQPELWSAEMFEKMQHCLIKSGILVSYCCKGIVKNNLRAAGFKIKRLPGAPGKREMLRAEKI